MSGEHKHGRRSDKNHDHDKKDNDHDKQHSRERHGGGHKQKYSGSGGIPSVGGEFETGGKPSASERAFSGHDGHDHEQGETVDNHHDGHEPDAKEAAMLLEDCTVEIEGEQVLLHKGTYVEVVREDGTYARCKVYSGHGGCTALLRLDHLHQEPAIADAGKKGNKKDKHAGYMEYRGVLWNAQPKAKDVDQGRLNDCYLLAPAAALAANDPHAIERLFGSHEPNQPSYQVTLHVGKKLKPKTVTVTTAFPSKGNLDKNKGTPIYAGKKDESSKVSTQNENATLWPLLLEKAYAMILGDKDEEGYGALDEGGFSKQGLEMLTGRKAKDHGWEDDSDALATLRSLHQKGASVCCGSRNPQKGEPNAEEHKKQQKEAKVVPWHLYWLHDIKGDKLIFRNPWGNDHPEPMTAEQFTWCFGGITSVNFPDGKLQGTVENKQAAGLGRDNDLQQQPQTQQRQEDGAANG